MNSDYDKDLYGILGVSQHAKTQEIKSAYRRLMKVDHPDVNGSTRADEAAKAYSLAWSILGDPQKRAEYDEYRGWEQASPKEGFGAGSTRRTERTPPTQGGEAPPQRARVTLTHQEASQGGSMQSIFRTSDTGYRVMRLVAMPPGLSDGRIHSVPPEVGRFGRFPRVDIEIVVVDDEQQEPAWVPPRRPEPEADTDQESPHWPRIAAAAAVVVMVLAVGAFGWNQFRGDDGAVLDATGQDESEVQVIVPPPSTATPTPSPSATPLEPGDGTALLDEVVGTNNIVRGFSPGMYVPQLGAHCNQLKYADLYSAGVGYGADGTEEPYPSGLTDQDIVGFHRQLNTLFNNTVALIQDASPTNCGTDPLWVSLANLQRATEAEIRVWCDGWRFPEGECIPRQVSAAMVEQARWVPYTLPNSAAIEVPWTMKAIHEDRTYFIDAASSALLTHQLFSDPQQAPTRASSVEFLRDGGADPTWNTTPDGGFALTGINGEGDVYYRRAYPRPGGTTVLTWWYPETAAATWNPAVDHVSDTFVPAG